MGPLSFAHLFSFPRINLITRDVGGGVRGDCRPRENVIWIRSYDDSNRNSTERTRHRLEIRFEFAGGDERTGVAMAAKGASGGKGGGEGGGYGRPRGSSFIHGAFTRYPRKADLLPALPRLRPSHSLRRAHRQPLVPPYIILLSAGMDRDQADIISSSRIHFRAPLTTEPLRRAAPEPRRRDNCNSSCVEHRSRGHYS